jgi:hypothetical protein
MYTCNDGQPQMKHVATFTQSGIPMISTEQITTCCIQKPVMLSQEYHPHS